MNTSLTNIRSLLSESKLDAILISSISNIIYLTNYSGFSKEEREAYLFITKNSQYILTDGRYTTAVKTLIPDFKLVEITNKLSATKILELLIKKHKIQKIGFEGHNITHLEHKKLTKALGKMSHIDLTSLRSIKNSDEISTIEKACKLGDKTFDYILKKICLGISEKEIAFEIEMFIKKHGADISFPPIVAFGKNSANPHHVPTNTKLVKNQIILMDFGAKFEGYCSDMTRTIFFGSANTKFKKIYQTVLDAQSGTIDFLKSLILNHKSISASDVDKISRNYIISKGYPTIPHSLGHGVGIQIHESPRLSPKSKDILKEGMVFSVEPGIYTPNFGGVRIEDLVALKENGPKLLTHSPKNLIKL
jgi:Xaa-Pro aminopeptidase